MNDEKDRAAEFELRGGPFHGTRVADLCGGDCSENTSDEIRIRNGDGYVALYVADDETRRFEYDGLEPEFDYLEICYHGGPLDGKRMRVSHQWASRLQDGEESHHNYARFGRWAKYEYDEARQCFVFVECWIDLS